MDVQIDSNIYFSLVFRKRAHALQFGNWISFQNTVEKQHDDCMEKKKLPSIYTIKKSTGEGI